jgi:hypothetical protein
LIERNSNGASTACPDAREVAARMSAGRTTVGEIFNMQKCTDAAGQTQCKGGGQSGGIAQRSVERTFGGNESED